MGLWVTSLGTRFGTTGLMSELGKADVGKEFGAADLDKEFGAADTGVGLGVAGSGTEADAPASLREDVLPGTGLCTTSPYAEPNLFCSPCVGAEAVTPGKNSRDADSRTVADAPAGPGPACATPSGGGPGRFITGFSKACCRNSCCRLCSICCFSNTCHSFVP